MNDFWSLFYEPNQGNLSPTDYTDIDGINMTIEVKSVGVQDEDLVDELKERRESDHQEEMRSHEYSNLASQER